jgi:hypothetical protein
VNLYLGSLEIRINPWSSPIVMMDESNKELSSTLYKQQKLTAAYEALKKSGFNFTSYEER